MYDRILRSPCRIFIKASGQVMSAGSIIFQAAHERLIHEHATMLVHYGYVNFSGTVKDFEKYARETRRITKQMEEIYLARIQKKNPEFTLEQLKDSMNHDWWISAREAVKLGLADDLVPHES